MILNFSNDTGDKYVKRRAQNMDESLVSPEDPLAKFFCRFVALPL